MPIRHDSLTTRKLAAELRRDLAGAAVRELVLDRETRRAQLRLRDRPSLLFLLHPEDGQILRWEGRLEGARLHLRKLRIRGVGAPVDERLLALELAPASADGTLHRVVAELHTNQWNLLLLRVPGADAGANEAEEATPAEEEATPAGTVRAALWPREAGDRVLRPGEPYAAPAGGRRWRLEPPDPGDWHSLLGPLEPGERRGALLRTAAWTSSVNADHLLGEAARRGGEGPLEEALRRYLELRPDAPAGPGDPAGPVFLLERAGAIQPYPHRLGREEAAKAGSLLEAMARSAEASDRWEAMAGEEGGAAVTPEQAELAELVDALEDRRDRIRRRIEALRRELEEGPDPGELREKANLLLARIGEVERGAGGVELEGFDGEPRRLELDPALSPSENADRYYDEAARRERARQRIPREVEEAGEELEAVEGALERLEAAASTGEPPGEGAVEDLWELAGGRPTPEEERAAAEEEALPYRRLVSSGGLEIRVGKGSKSNEELTFHHSHTEDVWLHARQVPGAHVILRWGHREGNPPRRDLLEAAVVAAVNSKARHSGTVAVDWTQRKYVRSPRKSAPGVVIPRNVRTLFVEPDEALVETLRRRSRAEG